MSKWLSKKIEKFKYQDLVKKDLKFSNLIKHILMEAKRVRGFSGEISKIEKNIKHSSIKVKDMLNLGDSLLNNPIFRSEISSAKVLEYSRYARIGPEISQRFLRSGINFDDITETELSDLVNKFGIPEKKNDLKKILELAKVTGHHLIFIRNLKAQNLDSVSKFADWEKNDWESFIKKNDIKPPYQLSCGEYSTIITYGIKRVYPSQYLVSRMLKPRFASKVKNLDVKTLDKFHKNNPNLDLRFVNFFDEKNSIINWRGVSDENKLKIRPQLMAFQRTLKLAPIASDALELIKNGYDSAMKIAFETESEFRDKTGFSKENANKIYSKALERSAKVSQHMEMFREVNSGDFRKIRVSNILATQSDFEKEGLERIFGSQDYCECEHCRSVLSPAAYFIDLMNFIDENISKQNFSTPSEHPLFLKNRRNDLWSLALTCDNTFTMTPYLNIVNEVLETYLKTKLEKVPKEKDVEDIYKKLNDHKEFFSFLAPFNLPLEETRLYLSHFGISLHKLYKKITNDSEKIWQERINLSNEEMTSITQPEHISVKSQFDILTRNEFNILDFIKFAEITREQLTELKDLEFYEKEKGKIDIEPVYDDIQHSQEVFVNLTHKRLDIIHRFLRLWKKTPWSISEFYSILVSLGQNLGTESGTISNSIILNVAKLVDLQEILNLGVEELISLSSNLPTSSDSSKNPLKKTEKELLEQIFDFKKNFKIDLINDNTKTDVKIRPRTSDNDSKISLFLEILTISETELLSLFKFLENNLIKKENNDWILNYRAFLLIYRYSQLAKSLKFNINDFIFYSYLVLGFGKIPSSIEDIQKIVDVQIWIKDSPFNISELRFILGTRENNSIRSKEDLKIIEKIKEIQETKEVEKITLLKDYVSQSFNFSPIQIEQVLKKINENVDDSVIKTTLQKLLTDNPQEKIIEASGKIKEIQETKKVEKITLLKDYVSQSFNFLDTNFDDILKWLNIDKDVLPALEKFFTRDEENKLAKLQFILDSMHKVQRIELVSSKLKLKGKTLKWIIKNPSILGIDNIYKLSHENIKSLERYMTIIPTDENSIESFWSLLKNYLPARKFPSKDISVIWEQDENLIKSLIATISFSSNPINDLEHLYQCLDICNNLGIDGFSLKKIVDDFDFSRKISLGAFISKYKDEKIRAEKLEPYQEQINVLKRDILADYILATSKNDKFHDLQDLYAYFLLDVEMGSCFHTSKLVAAISSLQIYIHRCMVNLEQSHPPYDEENTKIIVELDPKAEKRWEWRKNYRVWEANRKVFIYPENYLEPDLRDNKTFVFKELEEELLQEKITKKSVDAAYKKYVSQFVELSHLKIVGGYANKNDYYFFGRTTQDPPQYYYRKWDFLKEWTPWEKIDLGINSDKISAVIHQGKLFVFWMDVKVTSQKNISEGSFADIVISEKQNSYKKIYYSFQNENGKWVPPQEIKIPPRSSETPHGRNKILFPFLYKNKIHFSMPDYEGDYPHGQLDLFRNIFIYSNKSPSFYFRVPVNFPTIKLYNERYYNYGPNMLVDYSNKYTMDEATHQNTLQVKDLTDNLNPILKFHLSTKLDRERFPELNSIGNYPGDFLFSLDDQQYLIVLKINRDIIFQKFPINPTPERGWVGNMVELGNYVKKNPIELTTATRRMTRINNSTGSVTKIQNPKEIIDYIDAKEIDLEAGAVKPDDWIQETLRPAKRSMFRLSTSLADELGEILFSEGLEEFLSLRTQGIPEKNIGIGFPNPERLSGPIDNTKHIDFKGPYGIYYRELFFHIPYLIANSLNANQQFKNAKYWYERIFNPMSNESQNEENPNERNWKFIEFQNLSIAKMKDILTDTDAISKYEDDPFNPHAIARLRLTAYQKNIVMKYIDNLIDWGDYLFSQDTRESIHEATMLYVLANDILGKRPTKLGKCETVDEKEIKYENINFFEKLSDFVYVENWSEQNEPENNPTSGNTNLEKYSPNISFIKSRLLGFCIPENKDLLQYWDRVEDRLFKIRNCMNISGNQRSLSLFQPPINPMLLVRAKAAGLSMDEILRELGASVSPYRFTFLIEKAKQYTKTVQKFGNSLLSALEKKDAEELTQLRSVHERNILNMTSRIKTQRVEEAKEDYQAALEDQINIQNKIDYDNELIKTGLKPVEKAQQASGHESSSMEIEDGLLRLMAGINYLIPQVGSPFALKFGGKEIADSITAYAQKLESEAKKFLLHSASEAVEATFERREEEWKHQVKLEEQELKKVDKKVLVSEIRIDIAQKDLEIHKTSIDQADELDKFYKNKFTNLGLYNYLSTNLNRLYRESYNLAFDLAKLAEKSYQFERDDSTTSFIENDNRDSHAGLLSGERLLLQLQEMEKSFIENNVRGPLEITQSFSLHKMRSEPNLIEEDGSSIFTIQEDLFDESYPGGYNRIIKSVKVSILSKTNPQTSVNAFLSLTSGKIRKNLPDVVKIKDEYKDDRKIERCKPFTIAISSTENDSGLFDLNFNDDRYLPFEGSGAVDSIWKLRFPTKNSSFDSSTISDVIIHLSYTSNFDSEKVEEIEKTLP